MMLPPQTALDHALLPPATHPNHFTHLYDNPDSLGEAVLLYAADGLRLGEALVFVATAGHWEDFRRRLEGAEFDVADRLARGQITVLDAQATLPTILVNGMPDRSRYREVIEGVLNKIQADGQYPKVRVYGEMVNLLWQRGELQAASALEGLWNELMGERAFTLFCSYAMDVLDKRVDLEFLRTICKTHSHVMPSSDYVRFERSVWRAIDEVMGNEQALMVRAVVRSQRPFAASKIPDPHTVLLWLRKHMPRTAERVLSESRRYYQAPDTSSR